MNILKNSLQKTTFILLCGASFLHLPAANQETGALSRAWQSITNFMAGFSPTEPPALEPTFTNRPGQTAPLTITPAALPHLPQEIKDTIAQEIINRLALQEKDFDSAITTARTLMPFNKKGAELYNEQFNILLKDMSDKFKVPTSFVAYALGTLAAKTWLNQYATTKQAMDQEIHMAILNDIVKNEQTIKSTLESKYLTQLATNLGTPALLALYDTLQQPELQNAITSLDIDTWFEQADQKEVHQEWLKKYDPHNIVHPALKKLAMLLIKIPSIQNFEELRKWVLTQDNNEIIHLAISSYLLSGLRKHFNHNETLQEHIRLTERVVTDLRGETRYKGNPYMYKIGQQLK